MNFFEALQSALLKNDTKSLLKKDASQPKVAWTVDIARDRSKILKKEKEKRKMRKNQTTAFLLLLFYIGKLLFF